MFAGLRLGHDRAALIRAVMEGVSLETREILDVFASLKVPIREVRLTGGGTSIACWNQIQADIYGMPLATLETRHATLLGAAMLAACGVGAHRSIRDAAARMVRIRKRYEPRRDHAAAYDRVYGRYCAIGRKFEHARLFTTLRGKT